MSSQSNRKQSLLLLVCLGGLVVGYAYFFYLPGSERMAEMKRELEDAELEAEGTVTLIAAIDATQKQLDAAREYTESWEAAAPSEREISEVFERIHELTRLAETETTRFEPQSVIKYETIRRVPVTMECEGSFTQIAALLTALERLRNPIWLQAIDLESSGEGGEAVVAEVSLDVFADNLEDSDQESLSGKPITQEVDPSGTPL